MKQHERMLAGKLYSSFEKDPVREDWYNKRNKFLNAFNNTKYEDNKKREKLVKKYFGSVGKNPIVNKPFHCDYGHNINVGDNFFANFDCIMLDVNRINIGNDVMLAPRVSIYTAGHPIDKDVRNMFIEYGHEVNIGNDVWIGGNTVINPGVTIGNNVVIGSNSVVTKDIPSDVIAAGNPCRVIRPITEEDKRYWQEQADEYFKDLEQEKNKK